MAAGKISLALAVLAAVCAVTVLSLGSCPEKSGRYPTGQCDAYVECRDGVAEEKLCPDGLLFNKDASPFSYPCQYPIDVACEGRGAVQPAQATEECPHQFGYYRLGDERNCGQFMNCANGRGYVFDCPEGLAFNQATYQCDWPDVVADCDAEAFLGFKCPPVPEVRGLGEPEYTYIRSPNDCQHYFLCIAGKPRLYNCGEGSAFNELINSCDGVENVTTCAGTRQHQTGTQQHHLGAQQQQQHQQQASGFGRQKQQGFGSQHRF